MTERAQFRPSDTTQVGDLRGMAGWFHEHALIAWLYPVDGRLAIVGLELRPVPPGGRIKRLSRLSEEMRQLAEKRAKEFEENPPAALSRATLGDLQFRQLLYSYEMFNESRRDIKVGRVLATFTAGEDEGLTNGELRSLGALQDAIIYVQALEAGDSSPSRMIAESRGISIRSAQNRVGVARNKFGFLTPSPDGRSGGTLTPRAMELRDKIAAMKQGTRPDERNANG